MTNEADQVVKEEKKFAFQHRRKVYFCNVLPMVMQVNNGSLILSL